MWRPVLPGKHKVPHYCSPPWTPFRGCWRSAAAAAHDLILVEGDGKLPRQVPICSQQFWVSTAWVDIKHSPVLPGSWRMDGDCQVQGADCGRLRCSAQVNVLQGGTSGWQQADTWPSLITISHWLAPCFLAKPNFHTWTQFLFLILFESFIFILFFRPHVWDLSSLTRDRTLNPYTGSMEPLTTGLPGKSLFLFFFFNIPFYFFGHLWGM